MKTELFLIRHGQPVLQNALLGHTDSPLSQHGWTQLEQAVKNLENIDYFISSPLSRCADFSRAYTDNLILDNNWKECNFGDWDGIRYEELFQKYPKPIEDFFKQPCDNTPPNGESLVNFCQRIELALEQLIKQHRGKRIALLTHAGVIRTLVAWCLKIKYCSGIQFQRFAIDYGSMTHISIYQDDDLKQPVLSDLIPQLIFLNKC